MKTLKTSALMQDAGEQLNLMGYNLKFMYISAVGPIKEISNVYWKKNLYIFFQILVFIMYLPCFLGLGLAINKFWGDVEIITNIVCPGLSFVAAFIPAGYIFINWARVQKLVDDLESKSIFTSSLVQSNATLRQILEDARVKAKLITKVVAVSQLIAICSWAVKPIIYNTLRQDNDGPGDMNDRWKKLIFIMWLPVDPRPNKNYYIIYAYQLVVSYAFYNFTASIFSFIFSLITYSAAQFTIVAQALKHVDSLPTHKQSKYFPLRSKTSGLTEQYNETENTELDDDVALRYIKDCIRMHQSAIQ
ncbi:hypothetical protein L9F63_011736 [Diploptera punctata]|uniref:Odorant receptor n=1 Tax=Diploptera punctata TaxID=6984 RepID=A0AAD8AF14_DIPPU|nr:hypothetical protein L9F63_011736 [Diploptera punctata]